MSKGIGGHHRAYQGRTDELLTPPEIIAALAPFDLDPCSPIVRPWPTAKAHLTVEDDGLKSKWHGMVWCNPPYGPETAKWMEKMADHGNGIALIFARTETEMFQAFVWKRASAIRFLYGRLHFYGVDGVRSKNNSGGPSCLVAYGDEAHRRLYSCNIPGFTVDL